MRLSVTFIFSVVFTILFIVIIGYIDFEIITPLLPLPEDICYYHTHEAPWWVDLFYLDVSGHPEPPFSILHILLLLLISTILAIQASKKLTNYLFKRFKL